MLTTERDTKRGGERFAIPSQGEIEGKITVLESVAVTCLHELLEGRNALEIARLRRHIVRDLKRRCAPLKLCPDDEVAACQYAMQLFDAAAEEALRQ